MSRNGRPLAAIDIGTSSLHLAIAQPVDVGRPEILFREKAPVRLGSGASDMKTLDPDAVDRGIEALTRFRALADAHDADVYAVATSAVREAEDPSVFLDRARDEAGISVEVIPGVEEARLIHLGVLGALPISDRRHLVIDIGGGSTEMVVGRGTEPELARSFKIGHVRLTNRFFPDGVVTQDRVEDCERFIRSFLARFAVIIRQQQVEVVAGASGTFETVEAMANGRNESRDGVVTADAVEDVVARVLAAETPEERVRLRGVEPHRADSIVAGALLVRTLMRSLRFDQFLVSPDALREGLVLDRLASRDREPETLHHLSTIRASSVDAVAARYGENLQHARQSTEIALQLFDATTALHGLGDFERDVLEAAGMLHNIGRFVGHGAHHRHSYYLIRNAEQLAGFNQHELELIAQVARYHRKSEPKPSHGAWADLSPSDQQLVCVLSGMLRLGIGLDRSYQNLATDLTITIGEDSLELSIAGDPDELELEVFAARERRGLLERSLGLAVDVVVRQD